MGIHASEIEPVGKLDQSQTRELAKDLWAEAGKQAGLSSDIIDSVLQRYRQFDETLSPGALAAAGWFQDAAAAARRGVPEGRFALSDKAGAIANAPSEPRMTFDEAQGLLRQVQSRLDGAPENIAGIRINRLYLYGSAVRDDNRRDTIGDLDLAADFGFDSRYDGMAYADKAAKAKEAWSNLIGQGDERLQVGDAKDLPQMQGAPAVRVWENAHAGQSALTADEAEALAQREAQSVASQTRARSIAAASAPSVARAGSGADMDAPEQDNDEDAQANLAQRVRNMFTSGWQRAKVGVLSQFPVIGPHGSPMDEAELLLSGKKPLGWIGVVYPNSDPFDPMTRRMLAAEVRLDQAVKEGRLKAVDVVNKGKPIPGGGTSPDFTLRYYAQPGNEADLQQVVAYHQQLAEGVTPAARFPKSDGDYLGYRRRDQKLWEKLPKLPRSLTDAIYWFNRNYTQPAYLESILGHPVEKQLTPLEAAAAGNPSEQFRMGVIYQYGYDGFRKDAAQSMAWYTRAAQQGLPAAQTELGRRYATGDITERDPAQAAKWFGHAADQGYPAAMTELGYLYQQGEGVAQDDAKAIGLFRRAAEAGDINAKGALGLIYATGRGLPKDDVEAGYWFKLADRQFPGYPVGGDVLGRLTPGQVQAIDARVDQWQETHPSPLEALRQQFKDGTAPIDRPLAPVAGEAPVTDTPLVAPAQRPSVFSLGRDVALDPAARRLLTENSDGFLSDLEPVAKLRFASALAKMSQTPEGKSLVDDFIASGAKLKMGPSSNGASGTMWPSFAIQSDGHIETVPIRVDISGQGGEGSLIAVLSHEFEHLRQAQNRAMTPLSSGKIPSPHEVLLHNRFIEADAQATATEVAWGLKQRGEPSAWDALQDTPEKRHIAQAFEAAVAADPAAALNGYAKRAAFDGWFSAKAGPMASLPTMYDHDGIQYWPNDQLIASMAGKGARAEPLTAADYKALGAQAGGVNYLDLPTARPVDDPYYAQWSYSAADAEIMARNEATYARLKTAQAQGETFVPAPNPEKSEPPPNSPWSDKKPELTPGGQAFNEFIRSYNRVRSHLAAFPENVKIAMDTPSALVTALPFVRQRRINRALDTLAAVPEGQELVDSFRARNLPVDLAADPLHRGGQLDSLNGVTNDRISAEISRMKLQGYSTDGMLIVQMAHELQHLRQGQAGLRSPFQGQLRSPDDAIRYERIMEADAQATTTEIAWKLRQAGKPAAWTSLMEGSVMPPGIAQAYEKAATEDPASLIDGRAKRAAFDAWFTAKPAAGRATTDINNDQALRNYPSPGQLKELAEAGARPAPLTNDELKKFGALSGVNYLDIPGGRPLDDPYYYTEQDLNQLQRNEIALRRGGFVDASAVAAARGETVTLFHGTSEANLANILDNGFQPRYQGARQTVRNIAQNVLPPGSNVEDVVTDVLADHHYTRERTHEVGNLIYTTNDAEEAMDYAKTETKAGGELARRIYARLGTVSGQPFHDARPVKLTLEAPTGDFVLRGDETFRKLDNGSIAVDAGHELLLKANGNIRVKSVVFARNDGGPNWTFDGQPELTPEQARAQIQADYKAAPRPAAPQDPEQYRILKELNDFETSPEFNVRKHEQNYFVEAKLTGKDGKQRTVRIPDIDFVPSGQDKLRYFDGATAKYTMPYDLTPIELNAYTTMLQVKEQNGQINAAQRNEQLAGLYSEMERINPQLKEAQFDRADPVKMAEAVRGVVNDIRPADLQFHLNSAPRTPEYAAMGGPTASVGFDLAPETRASVNAQLERMTEAHARSKGTPGGLDDYYLVRSYRKGTDPFASIMDLPKDEAIALMERNDGYRGTGEADANGKRDQAKYHADRSATDGWLRENTLAITDRDNPLYFSLTKDPKFFESMMPKSADHDLLVVPLKNLDMSRWSFTYDDSMGNYFIQKGEPEKTGNFISDKHPLHGNIMDAATVGDAVRHYGTNLPDGSPREIEAQYWGKAFDPKALGGYTVKGVSQLNNADIAFLMDGDYTIRHVSSREHMDTHLNETTRGDAFPLSGMTRDVVDKLANDGKVPPRSSMSSDQMMEKYGDIIRPQVQGALGKLVQHNVDFDGGVRSTHMMLVTGMENAAADRDRYAFGKAGTQMIDPSQIKASVALTMDDIDTVAHGGGIGGVLTDKLVGSIRGLRTGDASLVADVRNDKSGVTISNELLQPKVADPAKAAAVRDWSIAALRASADGMKEGDTRRLDALAEKAIAADPMATLQGIDTLSRSGNSHLAEMVGDAGFWTGEAFDAAKTQDPARRAKIAHELAGHAGAGSPIFERAQQEYASAVRDIAAKDPAAALKTVTFDTDYLAENDPRLKSNLKLYGEAFDALHASDPAAAVRMAQRQAQYTKPGSFATVLADKISNPVMPAPQSGSVQTASAQTATAAPATQGAGTQATAAPAGSAPAKGAETGAPAPQPAAAPPKTDVPLPAPPDNKADGGKLSKFMGGPGKAAPMEMNLHSGVSNIGGGAVGFALSLQGLHEAYKNKDKWGMGVAGVNLATSALQTGQGILQLAGRAMPAVEGGAKIVPGLNIAVTAVDGIYQVAHEDTAKHRVQRGAAVTATAAAGFAVGAAAEAGAAALLGTGVVAAGAATFAVVAAPAVITAAAVMGVAYLGNKAIQSARKWEAVDKQIAEAAKPQKLDNVKTPDGKPSILQYKHLAAEMTAVSADVKDASLDGKPQRDAKGRIGADEIAKIDMKDPKNLAEFQRALEASIKQQQAVVKANDSVLPRWMRGGDSSQKYANAQMELANLTAAEQELDMYRKDLAASGPAPSAPAAPPPVSLKRPPKGASTPRAGT